MRIASVRGQSPTEWLAAPNHVYVGRRIAIRSGKNAGQVWIASPLGNPFKPGRDAIPLKQYEEWLDAMLAATTSGAKKVQQAFAALTDESVLGCWCVDWDGQGEPPMVCHAAVIVKVRKEYARTRAIHQ